MLSHQMDGSRLLSGRYSRHPRCLIMSSSDLLFLVLGHGDSYEGSLRKGLLGLTSYLRLVVPRVVAFGLLRAPSLNICASLSSTFFLAIFSGAVLLYRTTFFPEESFTLIVTVRFRRKSEAFFGCFSLSPMMVPFLSQQASVFFLFLVYRCSFLSIVFR